MNECMEGHLYGATAYGEGSVCLRCKHYKHGPPRKPEALPLTGSRKKNPKLKQADLISTAEHKCTCKVCDKCIYAEITDVVCLSLKPYVGKPITPGMMASMSYEAMKALTHHFDVPLAANALRFDKDNVAEFTLEVGACREILKHAKTRRLFTLTILAQCNGCRERRHVTIDNVMHKHREFIAQCDICKGNTRHVVV